MTYLPEFPLKQRKTRARAPQSHHKQFTFFESRLKLPMWCDEGLRVRGMILVSRPAISTCL